MTNINLKNYKMGDRNSQVLAEGMKHDQCYAIENLNISNNRITNKGAAKII